MVDGRLWRIRLIKQGGRDMIMAASGGVMVELTVILGGVKVVEPRIGFGLCIGKVDMIMGKGCPR